MDSILTYEKEENLYEILGCAETSTKEQIATEYRLRIRKCHPDKLLSARDEPPGSEIRKLEPETEFGNKDCNVVNKDEDEQDKNLENHENESGNHSEELKNQHSESGSELLAEDFEIKSKEYDR